MSNHVKPSWTDKIPPIYLPLITLALTTPQMHLLNIPLPTYITLLSLILIISLAITLTIKALAKWQKLHPSIIILINTLIIIIITLATGIALLFTMGNIIFTYPTTSLQILAITLAITISCIDILYKKTGIKSIFTPTQSEYSKNTQHLFLFLYIPFTLMLAYLSYNEIQNKTPQDPEQRRMKQFHDFVSKDARKLKN